MPSRRFLRILVTTVLAMTLLATVRTVPVTHAASLTFAVTVPSDAHDANPGDGVCASALPGGACTLRAAIEEANAQSNGSVIRITVPAGTYVLSLGTLVLTANTIGIIGAGAPQTIIMAQGTQGLSVAANATALISGVTITGGNTTGNGGGINNAGTLSLAHSTVISNTANGPNGGGGIFSTGRLTVVSSTVSNNNAFATSLGFGGGINSAGTMTLVNSTISNNTASDDGGGLLVSGSTTIVSSTVSNNSTVEGGGGLFNWGCDTAVTVVNSTVSNNRAVEGTGGGIFTGACIPSTMTVVNSTVSNNTASAGGGGITNGSALRLIYVTIAANSSGIDSLSGSIGTFSSSVALTGTLISSSTTGPNCSGVLSEAQGYNLDSDGSCGLTKPTDLSNAIPLLGPLASNGGPTQTMALLPGSLAIDHGGTHANGCPATDQRGVSRPQGPACDIGAYEAMPNP